MRAASRVPPGAYKVVCVSHRIVTTKSGIHGMKLLFKIVKPLETRNPSSGRIVRTAGKVIRHIFWATRYMLPYLLHDARVILGRAPKSMSKFSRAAAWIGKTCEANVGDEIYRGALMSRVYCFNTWRPKKRSSGGAR